MWGQVIRLFENPAELRIIPTRVGTSLNMFVPSSTIQDHPHACGDKFKGYSTRCHFVGSSPRVWGQVMNILQNAQPIRIIPTRVGTSLLHRLLSVRHRDHPHACGDKFLLIKRCLYKLGSSPRVWGQAQLSIGFLIPLRIIPTRVGTRLSPMIVRKHLQDHPHACGDKRYSAICFASYQGSSPRVWGQAAIKMALGSADRIIPTRVGTSSSVKRNG